MRATTQPRAKTCRRPPCGRPPNPEHGPVGGRHAGEEKLWNQKGADSGAFLFAGMARSYRWPTTRLSGWLPHPLF